MKLPILFTILLLLSIFHSSLALGAMKNTKGTKKSGVQKANNVQAPSPPQSLPKSGYLKTEPIAAPKDFVVIDTDTLNDLDNDDYSWNSLINVIDDLITTFSEISQAEAEGIQIDLDALSKGNSGESIDKHVTINLDLNKNDMAVDLENEKEKAPVMITKEEELKGLEIARKELEEEGGFRGGTKVVIYGTLLIIVMLGSMKFMKAMQKMKRQEKRNYYDEERTGMIGIAL